MIHELPPSIAELEARLPPMQRAMYDAGDPARRERMLQHAARLTEPWADVEARMNAQKAEKAKVAPEPEPAPAIYTGRQYGPVYRPFVETALDLRTARPPTPIIAPGLYGKGCLTVLQGEPESGKSWLALHLVCHLIAVGWHVIYMDEEGGLELIEERLRFLGADPDQVAERFHYFPFEARTWTPEDAEELDKLIASIDDLGLVVLDSLPDFLSAAGLSEDAAKDVTTFVNSVCGRFKRVGVSQLLLDHLPKPTTGGKRDRSRYSRGSGAKLAKADATLLIEVAQPIDRGVSGRLHLWKTKDRRGELPLPRIDKPPMLIDVEATEDSVRMTLSRPELEVAAWDGPVECMRAVKKVLTQFAGTEFSKTRLVDAVRLDGHSFRDVTIREAAGRLALKGEISMRSGARGADYFSVQAGGQVHHQELASDAQIEGSQ